MTLNRTETVSDVGAEEIAVETSPTRRRFRADIEGLRAVAVVLVVLYHAGVPWLPGGYIGVDVFFVLSGFLITGLLMSELEGSNRLSLRTFYARRIRRLLPASVLVLIATVVLAKVILPPLANVDLSGDVKATALYVSNIRFALRGTQYLQSSTPSLVQQYWSLAVEEHFYLVWPLLLMIVAGRSRRFARRNAFVTIGVLSALSFLLCGVLTSVKQPYAFFLLPTRAWELGIGALLALATERIVSLGRRRTAWLGWLGLGLVLFSATTFDGSTLFPGWVALIPVLGTAAVIFAGTVGTTGGPEVVLRQRPFVAVGRISYSLYLWHWPVLLIPAVYTTQPLSPLERARLVVIAVALAVLTYLFVENPVRHSRALIKYPPRTFALGGALTVVALIGAVFAGAIPRLDAGKLASAAGTVNGATPFVPSDLQPSLLKASADQPRIYSDGCHASIETTTPAGCVFGDPHGERTLVLFGDSHAAQWFPAMEAIANQRHDQLLTLTKSACPAIDVPVWSPNLRREYHECDTWRKQAIARINKVSRPVVVLSSDWVYRLMPSGHEDQNTAWKLGLRRTIDALRDDAEVVVLADTPHADVNVPICLSGHLDDSDACGFRLADGVDATHRKLDREVAAETGAHFADPTNWVCIADPCPVIVGDMLVFRDDAHLTVEYASSFAARLAPVVDRAVAGR